MAGRGKLPLEGSRIERRKPVSELVPVPQRPDPPEDLREEVVEWWNAYWDSDVARAAQADTQIPALRRLAMLYNDVIGYRKVLDDDGFTVIGSRGQEVEHPAAKLLTRAHADILQLEDRFGLSPRARISLGLQLTQARRSLKDLADGDNESTIGEPELKMISAEDL